MEQTIEAVFENGVFRPLNRPNLEDGQQVRLVIETPIKSDPDGLLSLAARVYDGLTDEQIDEIEQIALNRRDFFGEMAT